MERALFAPLVIAFCMEMSSQRAARYEIRNNTDCDNPVSFVREEMLFECLMTTLTLCGVNASLEFLCLYCHVNL